MIGIAVLYTTTEWKVVRNYMVALWLADIGHLGATYYVLGHERYTNITAWNAMAWGNIGVTVGSTASNSLRSRVSIANDFIDIPVSYSNSIFTWCLWF
jgi:hypothetical protein